MDIRSIILNSRQPRIVSDRSGHYYWNPKTGEWVGPRATRSCAVLESCPGQTKEATCHAR